MKKRNIKFFAALLMLSIFFGIYLLKFTSNSSQQLGDNSKANSKYHIQVILKTRGLAPEFWRIVNQGIDTAANEFDIYFQVTGPAKESDVETQIELMKKAILKKPDAIILAACDYELLAPVCHEAQNAGISVIAVDSDVNFNGKSTFVGTDNYNLGQKMGKLVESYINPSEKFGVIGHVENTSTATARLNGLLDSIDNSDQRLAGVSYCDSSVSLAITQAMDMIKANPDIKCMVGLNESSALGIAYALSELKLAGAIKIIACDNSLQQIAFMENGTIQVFVIQNPFSMGYLSMKAAVDIIEGKPVKSFIDTGSIQITREEMYKPENQKRLFPFTD